MPKLIFACVASFAILPGLALAQQQQVRPQQNAPDTKDACLQEVHRLCGNTFLPIPMLIQRCLAANESKLSVQCRAVIQAARANHHAN